MRQGVPCHEFSKIPSGQRKNGVPISFIEDALNSYVHSYLTSLKQLFGNEGAIGGTQRLGEGGYFGVPAIFPRYRENLNSYRKINSYPPKFLHRVAPDLQFLAAQSLIWQ